MKLRELYCDDYLQQKATRYCNIAMEIPLMTEKLLSYFKNVGTFSQEFLEMYNIIVVANFPALLNQSRF